MGRGVKLRKSTASDQRLLERWAEEEAGGGGFNDFGRGYTPGPAPHRLGRAIVVLDDGTAIGSVTWHAVSYGPNRESQAWNIGIGLGAAHRGKGYGTEAQRLLAAHLFDTTKAQRVEATTDVENVAEQRALEKAGFTREGVLRRAQWRRGAWHDLYLYSKVRGDP